jgi:hypothetical protein
MEEYLDIEDRLADYKEIRKETFRTEKGIRAIGLIYHDHSSDKKSFYNIFMLKDNIEYRLFSATEQYFLFIQELEMAEKKLQILSENRNENTIPLPIYYREIEIMLSSIFDSIIFHLSSVFDYFAHTLGYLYYQNKQETDSWRNLANKVRAKMKGKHNFCNVLDEVDRVYVGKLYDYRSRLIHKKRDEHSFHFINHIGLGKHSIQLICSDFSLKHFPSVKKEMKKTDEGITLTYLSSWLLKESFDVIEKILDEVKIDMEKDSQFQKNVDKPKGNKGYSIVSFNSNTKMVEPMSNGMWEDYKKSRIIK